MRPDSYDYVVLKIIINPLTTVRVGRLHERFTSFNKSLLWVYLSVYGEVKWSWQLGNISCAFRCSL